MKVLSNMSDQVSNREPFQIVIQVDDDGKKEQSHASSSSSNRHFSFSEEIVDTSPKQIQESIALILQLFGNCKLTTNDIFLKEKLKEINIQDGNFYFHTLQSLKHTELLIPHSEKVTKFIDSLKTQPTNVAEIFNLMTILKELVESSKKKKEIIVGLIKNYEENLKILRDIFENIKMRKGNLSKTKDLLPVKEVEIKRNQKEFKKWDREAKVHFSYVKGFFICFTIIILFEVTGFLGSLYLNGHHAVMAIVYCVLLFAGVIFYLYAKSHRSKANDYLWETNRLKQEMERNVLEIESSNEEDTRLVELYVANIICQIPFVLEYWKKHKDNLEELSCVDSFDKENMDEKWVEIKKSFENYDRVVSDILDRSDEENRRIYF